MICFVGIILGMCFLHRVLVFKCYLRVLTIFAATGLQLVTFVIGILILLEVWKKRRRRKNVGTCMQIQSKQTTPLQVTQHCITSDTLFPSSHRIKRAQNLLNITVKGKQPASSFYAVHIAFLWGDTILYVETLHL